MPQSTKYILPVLSALALYAILDFSYRNGYIKMILKKDQVWHNAASGGLRKGARSTGIASLDETLNGMYLFYGPALDGSCPGLSVMLAHTLGVFTLSLVVWSLESLRKGNRTSSASFLYSPTLWGEIGLMVTYAIAMPCYLTAHLFISATASKPTADNLSIPIHQLKALIISILLGFMMPCILVTLPERITWWLITRQSAIALWQLYPIWTTAVHCLANLFIPNAPSSNHNQDRKQLTESRTDWQRTRSAFRAIYGLAFAVAAISHIATWTISLTTAMALDNALDSQTAAALHPAMIFLNTAPWSSAQAASVGEGALWVLQWDETISAGAIWLWSLELYRTAHAMHGRTIDWAYLVLKTIAFAMVGGFSGAAVELLWEREEMVLEAALDAGYGVSLSRR
ncbi:uncharacterized protein BDV14DRAFT_204256 [Aspergillus stella-maris]|uniref:uncharacterized protein n=1 Tax=Aspergillus stella-maris TaxID=1810926 RepID=UPI003CCD68D6